MKPNRNILLILALGAVFESTVCAQEVLPKPEQLFKGKIGLTAADSTPDFPVPLAAPEGAPNVLLILEATGIPAPETINGIEQLPIEGTSMVYTWDKSNADAPTKHTTQYFEMLGNRAIYHEGWVACTTPATTPWVLSSAPPPDVITGYRWELYN
ncbi:MAG: hypothetical protein WAM53_05950, partial [Terrimicrobiaceae bacterium]